MKIAHVALYHYPKMQTAGPVFYVHHLARAQRWYGDEAFVVCGSERQLPGAAPYATTSEWSEGVEYVHLCNRPALEHDFWRPDREAHDPDLLRSLSELFAERRPDVVHIQNFAGLSFDIVQAARGAGARVVASLHNYFAVCSRDDLFFANATRCGGPLAASCSRCLGTFVGDEHYRDRHATGVTALDACDVVLAVSERVAEIYHEQGVTNELPVERIGSLAAERLWLGVGAERVRAARAGHVPTGEPLRLVFFGAGLARKGMMPFLQAVRRVPDPTRLQVDVYGGVDDPRIVQGFLGTCDPALVSRIQFRSAFSQSDLPGILAGAGAAVITPRWEDNGPQTVFESLAAGLPVLGTRVGGLPDVVHDHVNGVLVDEGDVAALAAAIDRLAGDRRELETLRAGIQPPRRVHEHARALRGYYGEPAPEPAHLAVEGALHGDLDPAGLPAPDPGPSTVAATGWGASWPVDAEPLLSALALAAAFHKHVPVLTINLDGDAEAAVAVLLASLQEAGIAESDLPDVAMDPVAAPGAQPIAALTDALEQTVARARADAPGFGLGYADGYDVAEAALSALDLAPEAIEVLVATERLEGLVAVAARASVTVLAANPSVREAAAGLGLETLTAGETPDQSIDVLVADGSDPVALAAAGRIPAKLTATTRSLTASALALAAFGLRIVDEGTGRPLVVLERAVKPAPSR